MSFSLQFENQGLVEIDLSVILDPIDFNQFMLCLWAMSFFQRTSLVAQTVKRLPTTWETWVRSLGREDPLEKKMATHSSIHAWKIPWTKELVGYSTWGRKESDTTE